MTKVSYEFWDKWKKAGELERERLIEQLPFIIHIPTYLETFKNKKDLLIYSFASQINSYLCDFEEYMLTPKTKKRNL